MEEKNCFVSMMIDNCFMCGSDRYPRGAIMYFDNKYSFSNCRLYWLTKTKEDMAF